jgi:thiol:disulfide interchange protein DsbD
MKLLKLLLLVTVFLNADFGSATAFKNKKDDFPPVSEAFKVSAVQDGDVIKTKIIVADKVHISADTLKYFIVKPEKIELNLKNPIAHEVDGDMVYEKEVVLEFPLTKVSSKVVGEFTLSINFSGCADTGICYNPQERTFVLAGDPNAKIGFFDKLSAAISSANPNAIMEILRSESSFFVVFLFLVLGLLLALTPCIFPMIPILSSIIVSQQAGGEKPSASKGFLISLVYVLSMAITYTIVGVISGLLGADIQALLQSPWVLTGFALMFFALAISLFGYYEMQLPAKWQTKINSVSDNAQGSGIIGTVIMGFLSAFIIGPCVAPPLAGAVIFISQTGDAVLGGVALFAMSMGMGLPLLLVGAGAGKFMPRPGGWMTTVSQTFGVVMLALAIFMLGKVVPPALTMFLWSLLFMGTAFYMGVFNNSNVRHGMSQLFQLLAFVFLIYGASLFVGLISGSTSVLHPFKSFTSGTHAPAVSHAEAKSGYSIASLKKEVEASSKPVVVDFRKKSCASCDELEEFTFPDPAVQAELKRFTFITIDVTNQTDDEKALLKEYGLFGTPSIIFFDKENKNLPTKTLSGFLNAEKFSKHLKSIH